MKEDFRKQKECGEYGKNIYKWNKKKPQNFVSTSIGKY